MTDTITPERLAEIRDTNNGTSAPYGVLAHSYIWDLLSHIDAQAAEIERLDDKLLVEQGMVAVYKQAEARALAQLTRYKAVVESIRHNDPGNQAEPDPFTGSFNPAEASGMNYDDCYYIGIKQGRYLVAQEVAKMFTDAALDTGKPDDGGDAFHRWVEGDD